MHFNQITTNLRSGFLEVVEAMKAEKYKLGTNAYLTIFVRLLKPVLLGFEKEINNLQWF